MSYLLEIGTFVSQVFLVLTIPLTLPHQMCLALRYLHKEKRIVHRDLTPNNIMLGEKDKVTIGKCRFAASTRIKMDVVSLLYQKWSQNIQVSAAIVFWRHHLESVPSAYTPGWFTAALCCQSSRFIHFLIALKLWNKPVLSFSKNYHNNISAYCSSIFRL